MISGFDDYMIPTALLSLMLGACSSEASGVTPMNPSFAMEGPHAVLAEETDEFVYFFPEDLGSEESWPSLIWFNGLSGYTDSFNYNGLLESVASWGFVVVGGKSSGMNPSESDQRDELLRRHSDSNDALFGRVDEGRIAVAGHSLGGFQTTEESPKYRVAVALQGAGTPTSEDTPPTLFMTSEGDEVVEPSIVMTAFERANNDAWFANHTTADHEDPRTDGGVYREPMIAFLRWQLHADANGQSWFEGDSCVLCEDSSWSYDER